jgi:CRP-like cAMP-binding protein
MMIEQDLGKANENLDAFITSSPEERYLNLLDKRPELLQRVPQHQIASYLGMTPESLSRIRKRVSKKAFSGTAGK